MIHVPHSPEKGGFMTEKMVKTFCPYCKIKYEIPEDLQFLEEYGYVMGIPSNICSKCSKLIQLKEEIKRYSF
jgi:hypothetical protein